MTWTDLKLVTVVCLRLLCARLADRSCHSWFLIIFILIVWIVVLFLYSLILSINSLWHGYVCLFILFRCVEIWNFYSAALNTLELFSFRDQLVQVQLLIRNLRVQVLRGCPSQALHLHVLIHSRLGQTDPVTCSQSSAHFMAQCCPHSRKSSVFAELLWNSPCYKKKTSLCW